MNSKIIQQGAEAVIEKFGDKIIKKRIEKSYRIRILDERIRKLRTRSEGKIIERASKLIPSPKLIKVNEKSKQIEMEFIEGKVLSSYLKKTTKEKQESICEKIGENISTLHEQGIIHGDLTPSNMILSNKEEKVYFIDFGLAYISPKLEDKAVDLHLLREALEAEFGENERWKELFDSVKKGYQKNKSYSSEAKRVLERFTAVERRGRYKKGS